MHISGSYTSPSNTETFSGTLAGPKGSSGLITPGACEAICGNGSNMIVMTFDGVIDYFTNGSHALVNRIVQVRWLTVPVNGVPPGQFAIIPGFNGWPATFFDFTMALGNPAGLPTAPCNFSASAVLDNPDDGVFSTGEVSITTQCEV